MSKKIKMVIYGEPGVGKSVFASKAPKPFFITTDGNYEWLTDFGADPDAHIQVSSWAEAKNAFSMNFDNYETIVVDLLEDLFKWCEFEYCTRNKLEHISDLGYGKGYDATRNEFFIEICKLIGLDKNIIFIMHGISFTTKDRRGVEHFKHAPSSRLPDKLIDMIEGRVRYFLRCYLKDEEQDDGTVLKNRYLSIVPKPNEFGIIRGVDENKIPQDIPLDFGVFSSTLGLDFEEKAEKKTRTRKVETKVEETTQVKVETKVEETSVPAKTEEIPDPTPNDDEPPFDVDTPEETKEETKSTEVKEEVPQKVEVQKPVQTEQTTQPSNNDKLAAIRAKLAAINANK